LQFRKEQERELTELIDEKCFQMRLSLAKEKKKREVSLITTTMHGENT